MSDDPQNIDYTAFWSATEPDYVLASIDEDFDFAAYLNDEDQTVDTNLLENTFVGQDLGSANSLALPPTDGGFDLDES